MDTGEDDGEFPFSVNGVRAAAPPLQIPHFLTRSRFLGAAQHRRRRRRSWRLIQDRSGMDFSKTSAGAVAGLPDDPLVEILSRVPAKSVCRFRCVCKAWRDLIDDPLNRRKLPQTLEGFFVVNEPMSRADGSVGDLDFINFLVRSVPLDIDRRLRFSFLRKLPENESLHYTDSCNGLLLLTHHRKQRRFDILSDYTVCNPTTKQWVAVPPCGCWRQFYPARRTFLAFDPAFPSHFHIIQFWEPSPGKPNTLIAVHAYSSETGMWSHLDERGQLEGWRYQGNPYVSLQRAFVNGILHLVVTDFSQTQMVAVDVQGNTKMIITMPAVAEGRRWYAIPYIGQSQGCLHYINHDFDAHDFRRKQSYKLSIWILQDYDTQEWVLKDTVSFLKLFGIMTANWDDFSIVAIHPDCNMVFFQQPLNRLIAYDMDSKQVSVVASLENENCYPDIASYIPCFSELPALTDKH